MKRSDYTISGLPCFPVKIVKTKDGHDKIPLTKNGHLDATWPPNESQKWAQANAVGMAMGENWYAIDADLYKGSEVAGGVRRWFDEVGLVPQTRAHTTISGGWHFIYRVPARFAGMLPAIAALKFASGNRPK